MDIDDFNNEARRAVVWTRNRLSEENRAWLESLPRKPIEEGDFTLAHGSPRDSVWEYILDPWIARANFDCFETSYCLVGHTHVPVLYSWQLDDGSVRELRPRPGEPVDLAQHASAPTQPAKFIINPGSVGQPRDNDKRAAYGILDSEKLSWTPCRVSYPFEITQAHMRSADLPERLILRLAHGW